jgi:uncharacterized protein
VNTAVQRRTITVPARLRATTGANGAPVIEGHAALFETRSTDLGGYTEILTAGCFREALAKRGNQCLLLGHDQSSILARRNAGTLTLEEDAPVGLYFRAELVNTSLGRDVAELVRTGHLTECSFAFTSSPDSETWETGPDGQVCRVKKVKEIFEVSLVAFPAYAGTSAGPGSDSTNPNLSAQQIVTQLRSRTKRQRAPRMDAGSDPYASGQHSYFRDLMIDQFSKRREEANVMPLVAGKDLGDPNLDHPPEFPTIPEARGRLEESRKYQQRALLTSGAGEGAALIPAGMPPQLSEAFTTANRAKGVMADILGSEPIPREAGVVDKIPGFTTGVLAGSQTSEGEAATEQKPATEYQSSGVVLIDATVEASQQLVDLASAPGLDMELAKEMGFAIATKRDQQILDGSGAGKQALGVLRATGVVATTYTDATPTAQKYVREGIAKCWSEVFTALGQSPDTILMSPVFNAWLYSGSDSSKRLYGDNILSRLVDPTVVPTMPLKKGGSSNEQPTIVLRREMTRLYLNPPQIVAAPDQADDGSLVVRFTIRQLVAVVVRKPAGVGVILGSGVKEAPAFT